VVAALRAATGFFAAEPELARLFLVEPISASPQIAAHFRTVVLSAVPYLRAGRDQRPEASLPESTEDLLLGGLVALLGRSVLAGESAALEARLPDLIDFTLAPYLGADPARLLAAQAS
jgi:hypothetical protein